MPHSKLVPLNTHPFFYATIALILGIVLAFFCTPFTIPGTSCFFALIFCCLPLYWLQKNGRIPNKTSVALFFVCFVLGFVRYNQQALSHASLFESVACQSASFRGIVIESNKIEHPRMKQATLVRVAFFEKNGDWQPTGFSLQIYTPHVHPVLVGDFIQINNVHIKKTSGSSFDRYLMKEGIGATLFLDHFSHILISRPTFSFLRFVSDTKLRIFDRLQNKMSRENFALFSSLFLGSRSFNKQYIRQLSDRFQEWGISHYLARSGLHLTIFTFVWYALLRLIPLSLFIKQLLLIALSLAYLLFSWTSISFLRALYSFLIYGFCNLFMIRSHFLSILALVSFIVLLLNPVQLFFLDFQLSFLLTFALAWISHIY
jgi:hypothetical protein